MTAVREEVLLLLVAEAVVERLEVGQHGVECGQACLLDGETGLMRASMSGWVPAICCGRADWQVLAKVPSAARAWVLKVSNSFC